MEGTFVPDVATEFDTDSVSESPKRRPYVYPDELRVTIMHSYVESRAWNTFLRFPIDVQDGIYRDLYDLCEKSSRDVTFDFPVSTTLGYRMRENESIFLVFSAYVEHPGQPDRQLVVCSLKQTVGRFYIKSEDV